MYYILRLGPQLNYKSAFYLRRTKHDHTTYFSTKQAVSQRIQDPVFSRTPQLSGRCLQANTDTLTHHGANTNGYSTAITHFYNRIPQKLLLLQPLLILSVFVILEYFPMLMPGYTKMSQLVFWNSRYFIKHRQSTWSRVGLRSNSMHSGLFQTWSFQLWCWLMHNTEPCQSNETKHNYKNDKNLNNQTRKLLICVQTKPNKTKARFSGILCHRTDCANLYNSRGSN